jgi:SAM-dependent methyltransferase
MAVVGLTRLEEWLAVLGCPSCGGAFEGQHTCDACRVAAYLVCPACEVRFPIQERVPVLLRPADVNAFATYGRRYREARQQEDWRALTPDQALALPFGSPPGAPVLYWRVRRSSYRRLMRFLAEEGPSPADGSVADLGAGVGWLSFRLAQAGYRVLALDASLDEAFGLGAAAPYVAASGGNILLAQGNLSHPPLRRQRWSLVVYNASLHYVHDLEATLSRAARALQPQGRLIILDTPIARRPTAGTGRGDRHLGGRELDGALAGAGLSTRWLRLWRGPHWWAFRLKSWLRRSALFSFPMIVAERG